MILVFTRSKEDSNIYFNVEDGIHMILLVYVDELFFTSNEELITYARRRLATEFKKKDLGMLYYLLKMEVW